MKKDRFGPLDLKRHANNAPAPTVGRKRAPLHDKHNYQQVIIVAFFTWVSECFSLFV